MQRQVFEGRIPIQITHRETKHTLFIHALRNSYIHLFLPTILRSLSDHTKISLPSSTFFTFDSKPIQWHLPIGLIYDILGCGVLPLKLEVWVDVDYPKQILEFRGEEGLYNLFMNTLKEADAIRGVKGIENLSKLDQDAMWNGLVHGECNEVLELCA